MPPATNKDLLGDDDDETSKPESLPDNSAEIGNLRNQLASTTRSLETTRTDKVSTEQTVTQHAAELSQLQTQLSSARVSFETESRHLANLRERLVTQRIDIQKTREELISAESELSATKVEKAEVEGSVLRDKEEIRDLQRKMKAVGAETDALKTGIEKAKKDVRQQKGLLAIAKKQLAIAEAEKLKNTKELEVVQKEVDLAQQEKRIVEEHISELEIPAAPPDDFIHVDNITSPAPSTAADAIPLPDTPQSTTPQPLSRQSTNPFERLAMASVGTGDPTSAFPIPLPLSDDTTPAEPSDIFIVPTIPAALVLPPNQTSTTVAEIGTASEPIASIAAGPGARGVPPASTGSPAENDAPFIMPPSHGSQGVDGELSETQQSLPGAYPPDLEGDGALAPLHEIENNESDTSDSDDEPLGTKYPQKSDEQLQSDRTPPGLEQFSSIKPAFDNTFSEMGHPVNRLATEKASPATSGSSSPKRSRSPGRPLSTRTLSSHSIAGAMDPFSASNFSHTPLEPLGGHTAPPPTIETVLEPNASVAAHNPSSLNDFDEALGKLPSSTKDASPAFKLDSAFDDNFDFSSAMNGTAGEHISLPTVSASPEPKVETAASSFPPVSAPLAPSIPAEARLQTTSPIPVAQTTDMPFSYPPASSPANGRASVSFDDAFGLSSPVISNGNGQQSIANGGQKLDVFGSMSPEISLSMRGDPFPTGQPSKFADTLLPSPPARPASPPIRPASPYQSPSTVGSSKKTSSPPLPPRATSPRLRLGSSSKAFSSENKAEAAPKHKLSVSPYDDEI
jgi:epidermal growth factor receptor substrate 15